MSSPIENAAWWALHGQALKMLAEEFPEVHTDRRVVIAGCAADLVTTMAEGGAGAAVVEARAKVRWEARQVRVGPDEIALAWEVVGILGRGGVG